MRKSAAVVLSVTSGEAVPCDGVTHKTLSMNFGAARFVLTVTFLNELLNPQSKLVAEFVTGPIRSTPAVTSAGPIVKLTTAALACTMFTVATVTVTLWKLEP
jgi:hypothetical protein